VQVPQESVASVAAIAAQQQSDFLLEYGTNEPGLSITATQIPTPVPAWCMDPIGADRLVSLIMNVYHGVIKMSETMPGKRSGG
jgi:hypothetical protein